ncbi:MAG: hypothetical protein LAT76_04400 [Schleiferiaceae bacterium]|nr:hypothetical protein [Schleiferiaceae bacterium]
MWLLVFTGFLILNTVSYFQCTRFKEHKRLNIIYFTLFSLILLFLHQADEAHGWQNMVQALQISWVYYPFLWLTWIPFPFLDSNKTFSQDTIKQNLRVLVGLACTWVSTDIYFYLQST